MAADVKRYVASYSVCQLTKPSQRKPAGFMYTGVDFVGPLLRTASGNAYLLVFIDYFSKWVKVCAVREATAQVAASKFVSEVFARHGTPTYLISDRGSPFISELYEHVLSALGSMHCLTMAYHPQTNATERVNRTLKTAIHAYVGDKHTTLRASLQEAHDHARVALAHSHKRQKPYYDLRHRQATYAVGDLVKVKSHPKSDVQANFAAKLPPLYTGPLRVTQKLGDVNLQTDQAGNW
uniref:Integrase catalytic domain-containing protein n=1 Tax=Amphilophus citrinellus TaxID=61819 RepID=A0A3Q0RYW0_AMPCI